MMNLWYFALWLLLIISVIGKKAGVKDFKTLTLEVEFPDHVATIKLWRVNRALANKYLPVWITTNNPKQEFKKLNIMHKVGKFTMFQDTCSKSAVVYFHDRHEITGVIDVRYFITRFYIDETREVHRLDSHMLYKVADFRVPIHRSSRSIDNTTIIRTPRNSNLPTFYPELLLAVNHDTYIDLEKTSKLSRGVATVSHMLTVYNAADLLYRLLRTLDIQLNIAGIVIEGKANQWNFESEVEIESDLSGFTKTYVNCDSIHEKLSKYFWLKQNNFPRHSYDIISYHTISNIRSFGGELNGQAHIIAIMDFMFPPDYLKDRYDVVVKNYRTYEHFLTIAHELAHIFIVKHDGHGKLGDLFDSKTCGRTIMHTHSICSESCLKWSAQAYQEFEDFFWTRRSRCNMMNYPRSLDKPEPKMIFSGKTQCECYGHKLYFDPDEITPEMKCRKPIICMDRNLELRNVPLPMDGTPCDATRVCWNSNCV